jgi:FkbM family methyltransferase
MPSPASHVQHPWPLQVLRAVQFGFARLRSRDGYVTARAAPFDLKFTGPAADCITRHIYRLGAHEPAITRYVLEHVRLRAGDVALDVGANLGWYSVLLDRLSEPGARIFAFEPDPQCYGLLLENLRANRTTHVTALAIALGDAPGTAELHRYKASNNGRHTLRPASASGGTALVKVDTLRSFWDSHRLGDAPIRLLKIDVEGFEYFVLRGAGELLRRCACVLLEYNANDLSASLLELLARFGFRTMAFVGAELVPVSLGELRDARTQYDLLLTQPH